MADPSVDTGSTNNEEPQKIQLVVKNQSGFALHFAVKPYTKMSKVMQNYCSRQGANIRTVRFLFEGNRIVGDDTPESLEMADGDTIEVHEEQLGG